MEHHPGVLELRVEAVSVDRRVRQALERVRLPEQLTEMKKAATRDTTAATWGRSARWCRGVSTSASDPNTDSTVAQKRRLPFWPAYRADQV